MFLFVFVVGAVLSNAPALGQIYSDVEYSHRLMETKPYGSWLTETENGMVYLNTLRFGDGKKHPLLIIWRSVSQEP